MQITLTQTQLDTIMQALSALPWHQANPVIVTIAQQQQAAAAAAKVDGGE